MEFDSTYPIHLTGIINRDEFQASIKKINFAFSYMRCYLIMSIVFFIIASMAAVTLFAIGGTLCVAPSVTFYSLIGAGIVLIMFATVIFIFGFCIVYYKRRAKLRRAIAEESKKYSSRSPIPCSWRLSTSTHWVTLYTHSSGHVVYQVRASVPF